MLDVLISSEGCHSVDLMLTLIDGWSTQEAGEPHAHAHFFYFIVEMLHIISLLEL